MICLLNKCRCKGKEAFWIDKINKEKVINNLKVLRFEGLSS